MLIFNKNKEINSVNIGEKYLMEVEVVSIENTKGQIFYNVVPTYSDNASKIYSITKEQLATMKVV